MVKGVSGGLAIARSVLETETTSFADALANRASIPTDGLIREGESRIYREKSN